VIIHYRINGHFYIILGNSILLAQIDDFRLHVDNIYLISEGIEIMQTLPNHLTILAEPLV
jgi:hypothetical protein